jgi:uncharacterized membrane protein (UPF0127 family)
VVRGTSLTYQGFLRYLTEDRFPTMECGTFCCDGWESGPVLVAHTFADRLKGLRHSSDDYGMLIKGPSVHGFGMKEPLLVIGLGERSTVVGYRTLFPRRVVWIRRAVEILELPVGLQPPSAGAVLTWERGGPADLVRNTHRKSE